MNENENTTIKNEGVDMFDLIQIFWKHKLIIAAFMIVCAFVMLLKTAYFTSDKYSSSGILYVSNRKEEPNENGAILKSDIDTARVLSTTYIEILKTSYFLEEVGAAVSPDYTWHDISKMISITTINDTELLKIATTAPSANEAYYVTKSILEKAPEKLKSIYKKGEVEVVDPPRYPLTPNDKNIARNAFLGAIIGIIIGALVTFIINFFDTKVRKGEDAAKRYNVSVLGEISE